MGRFQKLVETRDALRWGRGWGAGRGHLGRGRVAFARAAGLPAADV